MCYSMVPLGTEGHLTDRVSGSMMERVADDRSSRHTLPVIVDEDTLRPPTPTIDEDHQPLTWWKEKGVGERYIIFFMESFVIP
jgi:hypothetical protein